jgi:plastocyanin
MISILRGQTLGVAALLATSAVGFGCNPTTAPASPVAATQSSGHATVAGPGIVGTVVASPTGKAAQGGGVVYLEDAPRQPAVAMSAEVDVRSKDFSPFIAVVATGGVVTFGNKDALTHHVFSPDVPGWDTGYLQKNETATRRFQAPGAVALLCNIHPEMLGYVLVIPSTYFGKVGADGKYVIANVPPGTYKAVAWAPRMQTTTQSVTVSATGVVTANFELRPAAASN